MAKRDDRLFTGEAPQPTAPSFPSGLVSPTSVDESTANLIKGLGGAAVGLWKGYEMSRLKGDEASIYKPREVPEDAAYNLEEDSESLEAQKLGVDYAPRESEGVSTFDTKSDTSLTKGDIINELNLSRISKARAQGRISATEADAFVNLAVREASARMPGMAKEFRQTAVEFFGKYGPASGLLEKTAQESEYETLRKEAFKAFPGKPEQEAIAKYVELKNTQSERDYAVAQVERNQKLGTLQLADIDRVVTIQRKQIFEKVHEDVARIAKMPPAAKATQDYVKQVHQNAQALATNYMLSLTSQLDAIDIDPKAKADYIEQEQKRADGMVAMYSKLDNIRAYDKLVEGLEKTVKEREQRALLSNNALHDMKTWGFINDTTTNAYLTSKESVDPKFRGALDTYFKTFKPLATGLLEQGKTGSIPSVSDITKANGNDIGVGYKTDLYGYMRGFAKQVIKNPSEITQEQKSMFSNYMSAYVRDTDFNNEGVQKELFRLLKYPGMEDSMKYIKDVQVRQQLTEKYSKALLDQGYGLVPQLLRDAQKAGVKVVYNDALSKFEPVSTSTVGTSAPSLGAEVQRRLNLTNDLLSVIKNVPEAGVVVGAKLKGLESVLEGTETSAEKEPPAEVEPTKPKPAKKIKQIPKPELPENIKNLPSLEKELRDKLSHVGTDNRNGKNVYATQDGRYFYGDGEEVRDNA